MIDDPPPHRPSGTGTPPGAAVQEPRRPASPARTALLFAGALSLSAIAFAALGWYTQVRDWWYWGLLSAGVFLFLPVALILAGIALALFAAAMTALAALSLQGGDAGDGGGSMVVELGARSFIPYYRWLSRQRHPAFWGTIFGIAGGGALLYIPVTLRIANPEARTVETLLWAKDRLEAAYRAAGEYPKPDESGRLPAEAVEEKPGEFRGAGPLTDGFGRPLRYELKGAWKMASYRLVSNGPDGEPGGGDDLCVSGETRLARWAEAAAAKLSRNKEGGKASLGDKLKGIRALRCEGK